jgi:PAS domain S-box-containing protein
MADKKKGSAKARPKSDSRKSGTPSSAKKVRAGVRSPAPGRRKAAAATAGPRFHREFEQLLLRLSSDFLRMPAGGLDVLIRETLDILGSFVGADRSHLFSFDPVRRLVSNTHEWCAPGIEPQIARLQDLPAARFPWWTERIEAADLIRIPRVADLPETAGEERAIFEKQSIQSMIAAPLRIEGKSIGFLGFDAVRQARTWTGEVVTLIRMVADFLANALERERRSAALTESEVRFRSLSEQTTDVVYITDTRGIITYLSPSFDTVFGYEPREAVGRNFVDFLAPDSVDRALRAFREATTAEIRTLRLDLTMRRKDGSLFTGELNGTLFKAGDFIGTSGTIRDISERRRAEEALAREFTLIDSIRTAQEFYIAERSGREVFQRLLQILISITQSEFGYISEVHRDPDGSPYLINLALSDIPWKGETGEKYEKIRAGLYESRDLNNLSTAPITKGVVIANDAPRDPRSGGLPQGHPDIGSFLGVPMRFGGELIGVAGVANRPGGYSEAMAAELEPFINTCAAIIYSIRAEAVERSNQDVIARSEENLRAFVDGFPEAAFLVDTDGRIVLANSTFGRRLSQPDGAELIGRISYDLLPDELAAQRRRMVEQVFQSGKPTRFVDQRADRTIENFLFPVGEAGKPVTRVAVIGYDVTERLKIESDLQESEERYRRLIERTPNGMLVHVDGQIVFANPAAARIFGLESADGLVGRRLMDFVHPDFIARVQGRIAQVMEDRRPAPLLEEKLLRADGTVIDAEVSAIPFVIRGRNAVQTVFADISSRKKAENDLRESQATFEKFMNNIPGPAFIKDGESRYLFINRYMKEHFGADTWIGQTPAEHFPPDVAESMIRDDRLTLKNGGYQVVETMADRAGRLHTYDTHKFTIRQNDSILLCGISVDISARVRAEEDVIENLAEKETLLRELYHRTKNNMQVIRSMLLLQASAHPKAEASEFVKAIEPKIKAMALVHQMLYQSKDLAQIDLGVYLGDLARLTFQGLHQETERIKLNLDLQNVPVLIDTALPVGLVFNELMANALKYAYPGERTGEIRVRLSKSAGSGIELRVADDGIGVPKGFDPRAQPGFGLKMIFGLIEQQLAGEIEADGRNGMAYVIRFNDRGDAPEARI